MGYDKQRYKERKEYYKQYYQDNKMKKSSYQLDLYNQNPLITIHREIKQRCYNIKHKVYKNYGARGITMCDEWLNNFESFELWCFNNGYEKGLHIDRIDNDGNYEPSNCQFITNAENNAIGKKRKPTNNTSGYIGVTWNKRDSKWHSQITINRKNINLGYYSTIEDALQARIDAEIFYFGEQKTNL